MYPILCKTQCKHFIRSWRQKLSGRSAGVILLGKGGIRQQKSLGQTDGIERQAYEYYIGFNCLGLAPFLSLTFPVFSFRLEIYFLGCCACEIVASPARAATMPEHPQPLSTDSRLLNVLLGMAVIVPTTE